MFKELTGNSKSNMIMASSIYQGDVQKRSLGRKILVNKLEFAGIAMELFRSYLSNRKQILFILTTVLVIFPNGTSSQIYYLILRRI